MLHGEKYGDDNVFGVKINCNINRLYTTVINILFFVIENFKNKIIIVQDNTKM